MDDLCRELSDEFETIGESEKAKYLADRYEQEKKKDKEILAKFLKSKALTGGKLADYTSGKIYPNEPCPCGSGKKYKKCCGRR